MRRADRLFQLVQILRHRSVVTARTLAEELSVSERTVYRDIQDLAASGVPIEGESGVGYMLRNFELPPLMFDQDEIEALVFGLRVVNNWADEGLGRAARSVLEKLEQVLPGTKVQLLRDTQIFAPNDFHKSQITIDVAALRGTLRSRRKVQLSYQDAHDSHSKRIVRPLALTFFGPVWLLLSWCELRDDFRTFRLDRIVEAEILQVSFEHEAGKRVEDFVAQMKACYERESSRDDS